MNEEPNQENAAQPNHPQEIPNPQAQNRYTFHPKPYFWIERRMKEKRTDILRFLASGEVWTIARIVSHILRLSLRQTQETLCRMVDDKLLKVEALANGLRLYGITPTGLATVNALDTGKAFQLGKTPLSTVTHHLLCQKSRIELERYYEVTDWVPGKMMYGKKHFKKVPDSAFKFQKKSLAGEVELHLKSSKRAKEVFKNTEHDLGSFDDPMTLLHQVIYFTPHPQGMQRLIDQYVSPEFKHRFLVCKIDTNIEPYDDNKTRYLNQDLYQFLQADH